mgnify:CR=1 FL=1
MSTIQNTTDLLNYLVSQAEIRKDWFGFAQQRLSGIVLAHEIAKHHADKMTPQEIVRYVRELNQEIFEKIIDIRK